MRTLLLTSSAVAVSVGGFCAYLSLHSAPPVAANRSGPITPQAVNPKLEKFGGVFAPGSRPWVSVLDDQGRLQHRVRFNDYTPRGGNRVDVTDVDAEFFQYVKDDNADAAPRTQMIRILGKNGTIEVAEAPRSGVLGGGGKGGKGSGGPPKRGLLNDVTVEVYREWSKALEAQIEADAGRPAGLRKAVPNVTAVSPNLAFDNETFEITTQAFTTPDGRSVPADQVPVKAWGDYEFEGRGLTLRWNDVDGRLEYLEVAHGQYLVVRDAAVLGSTTGNGGRGKGKTNRPTGTALGLPAAPYLAGPLGPAAPLWDALGRPLQFAAKDTSTVSENLPHSTPPAAVGGRPPGKGRAGGNAAHAGKPTHPAQPPYRATFDDDVRVSQGERDVREAELARADLMNIDFMSGSKATTKPSTNPGGARPATQDATAGHPVVQGDQAEAPAKGARPGGAGTAAAASQRPTAQDEPADAKLAPPGTRTAPATGPTTGPATRPGTEPVIVRWTGKLRVVPVDAPAGTPPALKPGETVVHLVGEQGPVRLTRDASKVWCTTADYFSADDSAELRGSLQHGPVVIRQTPQDAAAGGKGGGGAAADGAAPGGDRHGSGSSQDATIVTQQLNYSELTRVAVLRGESSAHVLLPADQKPSTRPADVAAAPAVAPATQPAQALDAKWNREGRIYLKKSAAGEDATAIDHAEFEGDVDVKHPQLALRSQQLQLYFEERIGKPASRPAEAVAAGGPVAPQPATKPSTQTLLKRMVATTGVWCDLTDASGGADRAGPPEQVSPAADTPPVAKKQTITTDRLALDTALDADGRMYPRVVTADGSAHAFDDRQDLKAGHLVVHLKPATRPAAAKDAAAEAGTGNAGGPETAAVELESMRAWDAVAAKSGDGSAVVGQQLDVRMRDGSQIGRVVGAPLARITDASGNVIVGPAIDFDEGRQWAKVSGKGSIRANQSAESPDGKAGHHHAAQADAAARPATAGLAAGPATQPAPKFADIFWEREAELDGARNRIVVSGPVLIKSDDTDADGNINHNTAAGSRAVIELVDGPPKPAAAGPAGPATRRSKAATPPAGPSLFGGGSGGGAGGNPMDNKVVSAFNLEGSAVVTSTTADAGGILKQFELRSETLRYETGDGPMTALPFGPGLIGVPPAGGTAAAAGPPPRPANGSSLAAGTSNRGRLIVPGRGTLLYRDHRPPTKPAAAPAAAPPGSAAPRPAAPAASPPADQAHGVTAFRWERGMTYDQPTRAMAMLGSVVIGQQADDPQAERVRITGDRVDALFEPKPTAADATAGNGTAAPVRPAGATAAAPDAAASSMQPKWITLSGSVTMDRGASNLTAERADYNPATGDLIAVGTPRNPALFSNPVSGQTMWADQIIWNTQTWLPKFTGVRGSAAGDRTGRPAAKK